ncbi:hypothetical protein BO70DRAFT_187064 [Aspergillus heteromorphus CBS 117.55]|uniref:Uncharacterized protein n=1 Tax=Aspergillus heteromorphus CBS 117.55 TaxID=1448321 RepID=A0A317UXS4_9EURO|nr:uncharacterized protein BO70DRAFT_187064 [Aspergillus heteromorphus CBS 117.55]PWY65317.1 hypothetical protein BO70DRAFT_187064 [Aspergillus heteromorphus CBS 117.55]
MSVEVWVSRWSFSSSFLEVIQPLIRHTLQIAAFLLDAIPFDPLAAVARSPSPPSIIDWHSGPFPGENPLPPRGIMATPAAGWSGGRSRKYGLRRTRVGPRPSMGPDQWACTMGETTDPPPGNTSGGSGVRMAGMRPSAPIPPTASFLLVLLTLCLLIAYLDCSGYYRVLIYNLYTLTVRSTEYHPVNHPLLPLGIAWIAVGIPTLV